MSPLHHCPNHREEGSAGWLRPPHWVGEGREERGTLLGGWGAVPHRGVRDWGSLGGAREDPERALPRRFGALRAETQGNKSLLFPTCASASGKQSRKYTNVYLFVLSVVDETETTSV